MGGELRLWPARRVAGGDPETMGGGRSRLKGGEGEGEGTRVPGLVTAGGSGNRHPGLGPEMAGGRDPRVVYPHLLLPDGIPGSPGGPSGAGDPGPRRGEGALLRDCIWAARARAGLSPATPTWAGSSGQSRDHPSPAPRGWTRIARRCLAGRRKRLWSCLGSWVMSPGSARLRSDAGTK